MVGTLEKGENGEHAICFFAWKTSKTTKEKEESLKQENAKTSSTSRLLEFC